jgi:uracil-DNA glycosylase family 4
LADERARYLAQQIELGGPEVILGPGREQAGANSGREQPGADGSGREQTGADGSRREAAVTAGAPPPEEPPARSLPLPPAPSQKWKRGAPPIPPPGFRIEPPTPTLLGADGLSDLDSLDAVAERIRSTHCCALCPARTNAVPGEGDPHAKLVFIGEGPGATEDALGRPFVGQAGKLLDEIIQAIGLRREDVYITNIVKCRPPQNRKPLPDEMAACMPYLHRQLALIRPKVIVALGSTAAEALLNTRKGLGELRGKVHSYGGIPLIVTYHPAALLRNPNWKKPTWDDVRIARQLLDR